MTICTACAATQYAVILPLLPLAIRASGAGTARLGVVTGCLSLSAVAVELLTPKLLSRIPARRALRTGFVLMGATLAGLACRPGFTVMAALGVLFGVGFGFCVTVNSALIGATTSRKLREGLMFYSIAAGIPLIGMPPVALLARSWLGLSGVFGCCAIVAVVGIIGARGAADTVTATTAGIGPIRMLRQPDIAVIMVLYVCLMTIYGGIVSLMPPLLDGGGLRSAAAFFLVLGLCRTAARTGAAMRRDWSRATKLLGVSALCAGAGLVYLAVGDWTLVALTAALVGGGLGVAQTTTFAAMLARAEGAAAEPIAALWNAGVDGGVGVGALTFAPIAAVWGYRSAFGVMACIAVGAACVGVVRSAGGAVTRGSPS